MNPMNLVQNAPNLDQFMRSFVVGQFGNAAVEMIRQPLYDRLFYPTAGIAGSLTFFSGPIGSGQSTESTAVSGSAKTLADTNMTNQGLLPAPQAFWIDSIQIAVDPGSVSTANVFTLIDPTFYNATAAATVGAGLNDKMKIQNSGFVQLTVGTKPYLQLAPILRFPPAVRLRADSAVSLAGTNNQPAGFGTELGYADGVPGMQVFTMNPGVGIPTSVNFSLTISWPIAIATAANNARIQVLLDGWLLRAVQ